MLAVAQRLSRCKARPCTIRFQKTRPFQTWCSPECGLVLATRAREKADKARATEERKRARAERADTKEKLIALKKPSYFADLAQDEVNRYVRLRDHRYGCVSCHMPATYAGKWEASHFRSRAAASAVRFNLWNIHKSCSQCNQTKSGNIAAYTPVIRARIGDAKVDWLYTQNQLVRYEVDYLKRLARVFRKKANRMQKRIDNSTI